MSLKHTPAHHSSYPDRFEDEATGHGYTVREDTDSPDPRDDAEPQHAAIWAYSEPRRGASAASDKPEGNVAVEAFARYYERFTDTQSLVLTRRYLQTFHADQNISVTIQTIRGYSQGDWLDVVCATTNGYGTPESHINEFRMWVFGDVWTVIPDTKAGICNIYADSAEEALAYFQKEHEDRPIWEVLTSAQSDADDQHISELELLVGKALDANAWTGNDDEIFALVKQGYELGSKHALNNSIDQI